MQAYAEGDADAFQQLFDSLAPPLQAFFRRSVQDASVAEDHLAAEDGFATAVGDVRARRRTPASGP